MTVNFHDSIRKYTIIVGSLFNNVQFERKDNTGKVIQSLVVPIAYGPSDKSIQRINGDPSDPIFDRKVRVQLPRISYQLNGMDYAAARKINPNNIMTIPKTDGGFMRTYTPTPFDLSYSVSILVNAHNDGVGILERIIPQFAPFRSVTFRPLGGSDFTLDAHVIYNGLDIDDRYEGDFQDDRTILYNLDFTVQAYLFGPISDNLQPILKAIVEIHDEGLDSTATVTVVDKDAAKELNTDSIFSNNLGANSPPSLQDFEDILDDHLTREHIPFNDLPPA